MPDALDTVFAALADPTRRRILAMLLEDDMAVTDVASAFDISLAAISKHLGALDRAGLITRERRGRVVWCKLEPDALRSASVWMQAFGQFEGPDLDALETLLEAMTPEGIPGGTPAAEAPETNLLTELLTAERAVWDALQRGDETADKALLHPAFLGVYGDGPANRDAHAAQVQQGPTVAEYALDAPHAISVGPDLGLLTYHATFLRPSRTDHDRMWVSSLWRREADGWINLFSQDTPAL